MLGAVLSTSLVLIHVTVTAADIKYDLMLFPLYNKDASPMANEQLRTVQLWKGESMLQCFILKSRAKCLILPLSLLLY